jgi:hypothetical protein
VIEWFEIMRVCLQVFENYEKSPSSKKKEDSCSPLICSKVQWVKVKVLATQNPRYEGKL